MHISGVGVNLFQQGGKSYLIHEDTGYCFTETIHTSFLILQLHILHFPKRDYFKLEAGLYCVEKMLRGPFIPD